ncbi:MAG TPA: hypothetical protein V6D17_20125, partial [Candidatus Obscuribacterales bacterium]
VKKTQSADRTGVSVRRLESDEQLRQLASMASGESDEEVALNFARSLLKQADGAKNPLPRPF